MDDMIHTYKAGAGLMDQDRKKRWEERYNHNKKVLSQWIYSRKAHYTSGGALTHEDFADRLSKFLPADKAKSPRERFTTSVLYNFEEDGKNKILSEARVSAIAAYIKADQPESNLPKTLEGVIKWLQWKDPKVARAERRAAADAVYLENKQTTKDRVRTLELKVEKILGTLSQLASDVERLSTVIERLSEAVPEQEDLSDLTLLVQALLDEGGIDVDDDRLEIMNAISTRAYPESLVSVVFGEGESPDPGSVVQLIRLLNDLLGRDDWMTPEFTRYTGRLADEASKRPDASRKGEALHDAKPQSAQG